MDSQRAGKHVYDGQRRCDPSADSSADSLASAGLDRVKEALKQAQMLRATMAGFLTSFQSYIKIEVVEAAWGSFSQQLTALQNLDQLIGEGLRQTARQGTQE